MNRIPKRLTVLVDAKKDGHNKKFPELCAGHVVPTLIVSGVAALTIQPQNTLLVYWCYGKITVVP